MSIVFCGDLALPLGAEINYRVLCPLFRDKKAVVNLEGSILPNLDESKRYKWNDKFSLYSCPKVLDIFRDLNICYASLCNNHILDYWYPIKNTIDLLEQNGVKTWGLNNHDILSTKLNDKTLYIITFATFANEHSLKLFNPDLVVKEIVRLKESEDCYVVVFPHWGVEKNIYPEPTDRHHAHRCIDAGADLIIGHHPHIIQPIEIYRGKTIVYSVGNFILPQTSYSDKFLSFENHYIQHELVVEWDGNRVTLHALYYDKEKNEIIVDNSFLVDELYQLFSEPMNDSTYRDLFLAHTTFVNKVFRTRLFDSYFGELMSFVSRKTFRYIRKGAMIMGLHRPY